MSPLNSVRSALYIVITTNGEGGVDNSMGKDLVPWLYVEFKCKKVLQNLHPCI